MRVNRTCSQIPRRFFLPTSSCTRLPHLLTVRFNSITKKDKRPSIFESLLLWIKVTGVSLPLLGSLLVSPKFYRNRLLAQTQYDRWTDSILKLLNNSVNYIYDTDLNQIKGPVIFVWLNQSSVFDSLVFSKGMHLARRRPYFFITNPLFIIIPLLGAYYSVIAWIQ
jgi:hypothetical protein